MEDFHDLIPLTNWQLQLLAVLPDCNALSTRYGLTLNREEMLMLAEKQADALRDTGRIEFRRGPYEKLIYAFCDSPYLSQSDHAQTLANLCTLFYRFKSESGERWSDDELIESMKRLFDGECHGSLDLMGDRLWQALRPYSDEEGRSEEEPFDDE